jgi:MYXO-CTERM domain-containing protein
MKRRFHVLNGLCFTSFLTTAGLAVASGGDTWTTLAHDQSRTARASGTGAITAPKVAWSYDTGGSLDESQVALSDVNGDGVEELIFVSAGRVVARSATGATVWTSDSIGADRVIGVWDLDNVPPAEVVVTGTSPTGAFILAADTGLTQWLQPVETRAFDVLAVPAAQGYQLVLARQLGVATAFRYENGLLNKDWDSAASPWSVDMASADVDADGKLDLVRGRDRGFEVLDMTSGAVKCDASAIVQGTNAPMYFPAFQVADVNADGRDDVVMYDSSYYYSEDAGIFVVSCNKVGQTLTAQERWSQQWLTDTTPGPGNNVNEKQLRFLGDAVANYNTAAGLELVYSLWDGETASWGTYYVNATTGAVLAVKAGEVIEAIGDLDDDQMPEALLREATGLGDIPKPYFSTMRLYNLNTGAFHDKGWTLAQGRAATIAARRTRNVTRGCGQVGVHQNTDGASFPSEEVYVFSGATGQGQDDPRPGKLLTVKGADGTVLNEYDFPSHISGTVLSLGNSLAGAGTEAESLLMLTDGGLRALDKKLAEFGKNLPGNFARMPSVVSMDGSKNVIVAQTSPGHMEALDGTQLSSQKPKLVWRYRDAIQPESRGYVNAPGLMVPNQAAPGAKLVLRAHKLGAFEEQSLTALSADGTQAWSADLGEGRSVAGFENFALLDDLDGDGVKDFFLTELDADGTQQLVVRKGADGTVMVQRATGELFPPAGVYLQGHATVDLNGDGKLDIVSPLHGSWFVGIDVSLAGTGDPAQGLKELFRRNAPANGQAMVGQLDSDPQLDLLRVNSQNASGAYERRDLGGLVELSFTGPHPNVALSDANTAALISRPGLPGQQDFVWSGMTGNATGAVARMDGDSFTEVWFAYLVQGQVFAKSDLPAGRAVLVSPIAADLDGNGEDEVIVGSEDGYLYALRAGDGTLAFAVDLGAPVVHVLAADVDEDPELELVVSLGNGTLVALDEPGKYKADTGVVPEPAPEAGPDAEQPDGAGGGGGSGPDGGAGQAGAGGGAAGQAGTSPDGGETDAGAAGEPGAGAPAAEDGGCGCRTAGAPSGAGLGLFAGLALALAGLRRRIRRS